MAQPKLATSNKLFVSAYWCPGEGVTGGSGAGGESVWGWGADCWRGWGEELRARFLYHKKGLVTSLPENHYGERFLCCMGCSTHVGFVGGVAAGTGEGKRARFP